MPMELMKQATSLYRSGALQEARDLLSASCADDGAAPQALTLLARIHRDLGELDGARDCCRRVIVRHPAFAEVLFLAGNIEHRSGDLEAAISWYRKSMKLVPDRVEPRFFLGAALSQSGDVAGAIAQYRRVLELQPNHVATVNNLGLLLHASGEGCAEAAQLLRRAHAQCPEDVTIRLNLAGLLVALGHAGEARGLLEPVVERDAGCVDGHRLLGDAYIALGRYDDALASLDRALALRPDDGNDVVIAAKAEIMERRSDINGALALVTPYLSQERPCARAVLVFGALSSRLGRQEEAITRLESLLEGDYDASTRINILYDLGRLCDEIGDHDRAFDRFSQANAATHHASGRPFGVRDTEIVARLIKNYTRTHWDRLRRSRNSSDVPVFVVGMPRSGTTLLEQIIASHPEATGVGELTYFSVTAADSAKRLSSRRVYPECLFDVNRAFLAEVADGYLAQLTATSSEARRIVDKMPYNYLHVGLIALALPRARVIHMSRNPLDNCLSIFFNKFNRFVPGTHDLGEIAQGYQLQSQIMEYWKSVLDIPILEVSYEVLVKNQETETRRIIEFCGLDWSDDCLRFHKRRRDVATPSYQQVQKKMYSSSIDRWRNYDSHLAPLREALGLPANDE